MDPAVEALFARREPVVRDIYEALIARLNGLGPVTVEAKRTSIHLARRSAFAGIHPRKGSILLNIRTDAPIEGPRIRTREQVSRNRFHNELLLTEPAEVDSELMGWLAAAYALSA